MKKRTFPVAPDLPAWRLTLGLVLVFLPFTTLSSGILVMVLSIRGQAGGPELFAPILLTLLSAGVVHELGHWLASQPGARVRGIITTPGLATVRMDLEPELEPGSGRYTLRMLGGALANLVVVGVCLVTAEHYRSELWHSPWFQGALFFHLITAGGNLLPLKTGFTGATDGWLLWEGFKARRRAKEVIQTNLNYKNF